MCAHLNVCIRVCVHVCVTGCVYTCVRASVCVHVCVNVRACVCVGVRLHSTAVLSVDGSFTSFSLSLSSSFSSHLLSSVSPCHTALRDCAYTTGGAAKTEAAEGSAVCARRRVWHDASDVGVRYGGPTGALLCAVRCPLFNTNSNITVHEFLLPQHVSSPQYFCHNQSASDRILLVLQKCIT